MHLLLFLGIFPFELNWRCCRGFLFFFLSRVSFLGNPFRRLGFSSSVAEVQGR